MILLKSGNITIGHGSSIECIKELKNFDYEATVEITNYKSLEKERIIYKLTESIKSRINHIENMMGKDIYKTDQNGLIVLLNRKSELASILKEIEGY